MALTLRFVKEIINHTHIVGYDWTHRINMVSVICGHGKEVYWDENIKSNWTIFGRSLVSYVLKEK